MFVFGSTSCEVDVQRRRYTRRQRADGGWESHRLFEGTQAGHGRCWRVIRTRMKTRCVTHLFVSFCFCFCFFFQRKVDEVFRFSVPASSAVTCMQSPANHTRVMTMTSSSIRAMLPCIQVLRPWTFRITSPVLRVELTTR